MSQAGHSVVSLQLFMLLDSGFMPKETPGSTRSQTRPCAHTHVHIAQQLDKGSSTRGHGEKPATEARAEHGLATHEPLDVSEKRPTGLPKLQNE